MMICNFSSRSHTHLYSILQCIIQIQSMVSHSSCLTYICHQLSPSLLCPFQMYGGVKRKTENFNEPFMSNPHSHWPGGVGGVSVKKKGLPVHTHTHHQICAAESSSVVFPERFSSHWVLRRELDQGAGDGTAQTQGSLIHTAHFIFVVKTPCMTGIQ